MKTLVLLLGLIFIGCATTQERHVHKKNLYYLENVKPNKILWVKNENASEVCKITKGVL